jgi:hypothetical protein
MRNVLADAAPKMDARAEATIQNFLQDADHSYLVEHAICNSPQSLASAIPRTQLPATRPAGCLCTMDYVWLVAIPAKRKGAALAAAITVDLLG